MNGANPNGSARPHNPDTYHANVVDAQEAYNYAISQDGANSPQFNAPINGAGLTLDQQYYFVWMWCYILWPSDRSTPRLSRRLPIRPNPPDPAPYYALVNRLLPELQKLIVPVVEQSLTELCADLARKVAPISDRTRTK